MVLEVGERKAYAIWLSVNELNISTDLCHPLKILLYTYIHTCTCPDMHMPRHIHRYLCMYSICPDTYMPRYMHRLIRICPDIGTDTLYIPYAQSYVHKYIPQYPNPSYEPKQVPSNCRAQLQRLRVALEYLCTYKICILYKALQHYSTHSDLRAHYNYVLCVYTLLTDTVLNITL